MASERLKGVFQRFFLRPPCTHRLETKAKKVKRKQQMRQNESKDSETKANTVKRKQQSETKAKKAKQPALFSLTTAHPLPRKWSNESNKYGEMKAKQVKRKRKSEMKANK
jgi:hypothetical protein